MHTFPEYRTVTYEEIRDAYLIDFAETKPLSPGRKMAGIKDFALHQVLPKSESMADLNPKQLQAEKDLKQLLNFTVGGVKMKIKDIKNIHVFDEIQA